MSQQNVSEAGSLQEQKSSFPENPIAALDEIAQLADKFAPLPLPAPKCQQSDITRLSMLLEGLTSDDIPAERRKQMVHAINRLLRAVGHRLTAPDGSQFLLVATVPSSQKGYVQFRRTEGGSFGRLGKIPITLAPLKEACKGKVRRSASKPKFEHTLT